MFLSVRGAVWLFTLLLFALQTSPRTHALTATPSLAASQLSVNMQTSSLGIPPEEPRLAWILIARHKNQRDLRQTAYRILVASSAAGLAVDKGDAWDSGRVRAELSIQVTYAGAALVPGTTYYWKVAVWDQGGRQGPWSGAATFTTSLRIEDWHAQWIAASPDRPVSAPAIEGRAQEQSETMPLPLFRKTLVVDKPIKSALVFVSGLGQYELRVNGHSVADSVLNPGWTDYQRTILYNSYDVTKLLQSGQNVLGLLLGNGMYDVPDIKGRYSKFTGSYGQPKAILQLVVHYADGSSSVIVSDHSWTTHPGSILFSSIYGGEDTDASREPRGWDLPVFAAADWELALEVSGPGGQLALQMSPPITVSHIYPALRVSEPRPGVLVYDLGQNMSGWPMIALRGPKGSTVNLKPGELIDADGLVTQHSGGGSAAQPILYRYTLRGQGVETWHPEFSYAGFRYIEVDGATTAHHPKPQTPVLLSVSGAFVHAAVAKVGAFHSSDHLFNRIHKLIDMAILSNAMSIITDCPTREKLGWLEQTYLNGGPLFLNYDMRTTYAKMAADMRDSQLSDGMVPGIAPEYVHFVDSKGVNTVFRDSPEWGSAAILSPWTLYQYSGDRHALDLAYPTMQHYAAYLLSRADKNILNYGLGDWYDIGPKPPGESQLTSKTVTATATFYADLIALEQIAGILNHPDDASRYRRQADAVRDAFNAQVFHPETNQYDRGSQTANAMPLALGMVPPGHEQAVLANLVADIKIRHDHVTAGDIGFHYLVRALTNLGRSDVLANIISRTDSPSYGYQLTRGATTLTEAWDTNRDDSQNHFMLGHGEEWFYRGLAGIRFDFADTTSTIRLEPYFPVGVHSAGASYDSVLGSIHSSWTREKNRVRWQITIPPGTTALVSFRGLDQQSVQELGTTERLANEKVCSTASADLVCTFGSGDYTFFSRLRL